MCVLKVLVMKPVRNAKHDEIENMPFEASTKRVQLIYMDFSSSFNLIPLTIFIVFKYNKFYVKTKTKNRNIGCRLIKWEISRRAEVLVLKLILIIWIEYY